MEIETSQDKNASNNKVFFENELHVANSNPTDSVDLTFAEVGFNQVSTVVLAGNPATPLFANFAVVNRGQTPAGDYDVDFSLIQDTTESALETQSFSGVPANGDPITGAGRVGVGFTDYDTGSLTQGASYLVKARIVSAQDVNTKNNTYIHPVPVEFPLQPGNLEFLEDWVVLNPDPNNIAEDVENCLRIRGSVRNNGPGPSLDRTVRVELGSSYGRTYEFIRDADEHSLGTPAFEMEQDERLAVPPLAPNTTALLEFKLPLANFKVKQSAFYEGQFVSTLGEPIRPGLRSIRLLINGPPYDRLTVPQRIWIRESFDQVDLTAEGFTPSGTVFQPNSTLTVSGGVVRNRRSTPTPTNPANLRSPDHVIRFYLGDTPRSILCSTCPRSISRKLTRYPITNSRSRQTFPGEATS